METIENKVFEKKYPSSGCMFFPLGLLMLGLIIIIILASISKQTYLIGISLILVLACLTYFCFSRCFPRISIGIYPTHITINNVKFLWSDIKHITFYKEHNYTLIQIGLNKRKYIQQVIILLILIIIAISLTIMTFTVPYNPSGRVGMVSGLIFFLPAMFGINIFRPKTREVCIESDLDTILDCTKYYADLYHIPLENKIDKKQY